MVTKAQTVRFKNTSKSLQVIYTEEGVKKEVIPQGVVMLTPEWGSRYRCLTKLDPSKKVPPSSPKTKVVE